MNDKIVELHRIEYPDEYATKYIFTYPTFNDELEELISKSGYVNEFKSKYHISLRFLENLKMNCIMQPKRFEQLLKADGLYSIMLKGRMNIRILFDFQKVGGREVAILYNCFQEKRTKDYAAEISLAKERREQLSGV